MKRGSRTNALVVELMIAVLFFMLASTILARVFGEAHRLSELSRIRSNALTAAANLADLAYAAADMDELARQEGLTAAENGSYEKTDEADGFTLTLRVQAGALRRASVEARSGDELIVSLPCSRYLPEGSGPENGEDEI